MTRKSERRFLGFLPAWAPREDAEGLARVDPLWFAIGLPSAREGAVRVMRRWARGRREVWMAGRQVGSWGSVSGSFMRLAHHEHAMRTHR